MMPAMSKGDAMRGKRRVSDALDAGPHRQGSGRDPTVDAGDIGGAFGSKTVLNQGGRRAVRGRTSPWAVGEVDRGSQRAFDRRWAGQEETLNLQVAVKNDGTIPSFRVGMTMDVGAYPALSLRTALFSRVIRGHDGAVSAPGPYVETMLTASNRGLTWSPRPVGRRDMGA